MLASARNENKPLVFNHCCPEKFSPDTSDIEKKNKKQDLPGAQKRGAKTKYLTVASVAIN
jgi:hypothetical protein